MSRHPNVLTFALVIPFKIPFLRSANLVILVALLAPSTEPTVKLKALAVFYQEETHALTTGR
jgi:hypothetical protein